MEATTVAVIAALPWLIVPVIGAIRLRNSRSLDDESAAAPEPAPLVSVIVPARNEARNIERCMRSILSTTYPAMELIVVDDSSADGTGAIAERVAAEDPRARVIANEPLPDGWFGKQWACWNGAKAALGEIFCFADADAIQGPELLVRSVSAIRRRNADLFSVAGWQEIESFWEILVQPQVFALLHLRYGGTETVSGSPRVTDKIANGQCLFIRRTGYEAMGGHALVKSHVGEDMMLAQRFFAAGRRVVFEEGIRHHSTRMYTSWRELVEGWGKNVYAAGRDTVPFGRVGRSFFPVILLSAPLTTLMPGLVLILALMLDLPDPLMIWAAISGGALLLSWSLIYRWLGKSPLYAFLVPLGGAAVLYIFGRAVFRGQSVEWKGRKYRSAES